MRSRSTVTREALGSSSEDCANRRKSFKTPAGQSSVSWALSLGVEDGGAGEKGEPVGTGQGLLLMPGASQQGRPLPSRGGLGTGRGCL